MSDDNSTMYYKTIGETICDQNCPSGQYIDSDVDFKCQPCGSECVSCYRDPHNCTEADGCAFGLYFYNVTNTCLAECPDGYYADPITDDCIECAGGCELCSAGGYSHCTKCNTDNATGVTYYKRMNIDKCVDECPKGQYEIDEGNLCAYCHESCSECSTSATECQACKNVTGIVYYNLYNSTCYQNCPTGYYGVQ